MTTADDKRLQDQVNAANNAGTVAASICDHYWAWVSPAGTRHSARLCMSCHAPDPDWLNEVHAAAVPTVEVHCAEHGGPLGDQGCVECERAYGEVGSGVCDCGLPSMHHDWGMACATGNDFDPPISADDTPPDTHAEECVQHRTHGFAACICTPPDSRSEVETLRLYEGAVMRYVVTNAPTRTDVDVTPDWIGNVATALIEARPLASDWLAQHDAQVAAKALRDAARGLTQGPDYHQRTSVFAKRLRDCADRIGGSCG